MFYAQDLAHIHDLGFGNFAECAGSYLLKQLKVAGIPSGLVVDIGCGSGILARRLTDAGYDAVGLDIAEDMLKLARRKAPLAKFVRASIYGAELPSCAAAVCSGEIINYVGDAKISWTTRRRFLREVYRALVPGALFLLDFATVGRVGPDGDYHRIFEGDDWLLALDCQENAKKKRLTRNMKGFARASGGRNLYRRFDEIHTLDLLDKKQVVSELRSIGFRVRNVKQYGKMKLPPGYCALIARK